jgi:hypothetical protein
LFQIIAQVVGFLDPSSKAVGLGPPNRTPTLASMATILACETAERLIEVNPTDMGMRMVCVLNAVRALVRGSAGADRFPSTACRRRR